MTTGSVTLHIFLLFDFSITKILQAASTKVSANWRYQRRWLIAMVVSSGAYLVIMHAIYPIYSLLVGVRQIPILIWCRFFYIGMYRMIHVVQFSLASLALRYRFKKFNIHLTTLRNQNGSDIAKLYNKLCDGIEILNETLTFHFVFNFTSMTVSCL